MHVNKIPMNWKCPHCSERLPELGFFEKYFDGLSEYLVDKTSIFWGIILGLFIGTISVFELFLGHGFLVRYVSDNFIFSMMMLILGAMVLDMYMKVVLPLQLPFGSDFIVKERKVIRNIRKGSHLALILGIIVCLSWLGTRTFFEYFPSYLVVISCFLALSWAISSLFLDIRMVDDVRFRHYMDRLGITNLKFLRKVSTAIISLLFGSFIVFFILNQIPNLWRSVSAWSAVGTVIYFVKNYLDWLL